MSCSSFTTPTAVLTPKPIQGSLVTAVVVRAIKAEPAKCFCLSEAKDQLSLQVPA